MTQRVIAIPDDHPVWRLVGAWLAARERGADSAWQTLVTAVEPYRSEVLADAPRLFEPPLRTGADVVVDARGRLTAEGPFERAIADLEVLVGWDDDGQARTARLSLPLVVEEADGTWRIARALHARDRALLDDPQFAQFARAVAEGAHASHTHGEQT